MVGCVLIILADISGHPVDGTTGSDLALGDKNPALVDTDFPIFEQWMLESFYFLLLNTCRIVNTHGRSKRNHR